MARVLEQMEERVRGMERRAKQQQEENSKLQDYLAEVARKHKDAVQEAVEDAVRAEREKRAAEMREAVEVAIAEFVPALIQGVGLQLAGQVPPVTRMQTEALVETAGVEGEVPKSPELRCKERRRGHRVGDASEVREASCGVEEEGYAGAARLAVRAVMVDHMGSAGGDLCVAQDCVSILAPGDHCGLRLQLEEVGVGGLAVAVSSAFIPGEKEEPGWGAEAQAYGENMVDNEGAKDAGVSLVITLGEKEELGWGGEAQGHGEYTLDNEVTKDSNTKRLDEMEANSKSGSYSISRGVPGGWQWRICRLWSRWSGSTTRWRSHSGEGMGQRMMEWLEVCGGSEEG